MKLTCHGCGKQVGIKINDAVIHIDEFKVSERGRAEKAWEAGHVDGWEPRDLATYPSPVCWEVHCDSCNPHLDADGAGCYGCYWFDASRANTPTRLLHWTAHLMGKRWLGDTNWGSFIRPFGEDA